MIVLEKNSTKVTIESAYGFSEEQPLSEVFSHMMDHEEDRKLHENIESDHKREEILQEQIYFAENLISFISEKINSLPKNPLKHQYKELIKEFEYEIENSSFEL